MLYMWYGMRAKIMQLFSLAHMAKSFLIYIYVSSTS